MDFGYLLRILNRRKWLILAVMAAASLATYVLIGRKPAKYKASVVLSTGIVNYKGFNSNGTDGFVQQYQIENAFSNLTEFAQSRSSIKLTTMHLLKHDLSAEATGGQPFRKPNPKVAFSQEEKKALYEALLRINLDSIADPAYGQAFDYQLDRIGRAYGYDHDALLRCLQVRRRGGTDYLTISATTDSPKLSQFMADAYVQRFTTFFHNLSIFEKKKNVAFFENLAVEKKAVVDEIKKRKYDYLKAKSLPALAKKTDEVIAQLSGLEMDRQREEARYLSATEQAKTLQRYIDDKSTLDATGTRDRVVQKNATEDLQNRVRELTERSLRAKGDPSLQAQLSSARQELDNSLRSGARNISNPPNLDTRHTKEDLFKDRVDAELTRIEAEKNFTKIDKEISALTGQLRGLVESDEVASNLQAEQDRADEEFAKVNDDLVKAKLLLENATNPMSVIENAQMPEWPEPDRQVLLSVFAGLVTGTLAVIIIFLLAYLDNSLQSAELFNRFTDNLPLMGSVASVPVRNIDFHQVFSSNGNMPMYQLFRENLRKLRNQLLTSTEKVFLFVSTKPREGKTFLMYSLAHALAANKKRILLLDTNFKSPLPAAFAQEPTSHADLLNHLTRLYGLDKVFEMKQAGGQEGENLVDVLGNLGGPESPSEKFESATFEAFLNDLKTHYDFIFLESAALNNYADAQELAPFVDKIIAIFNAGSAITTSDRESIAYLKQLNGKFAGSVLTAVDAKNL